MNYHRFLRHLLITLSPVVSVSLYSQVSHPHNAARCALYYVMAYLFLVSKGSVTNHH